MTTPSPRTPATLFALDAGEALAARLAAAPDMRRGGFEHRRFPDGESYFRITAPKPDGAATVLTDLSRPDGKFLPLTLFAETLRDVGFEAVGLVAPYLPYMRQDRRFRDGEGLTSKYFAAMLCAHFDWLVTVDPHLHRYHGLDEIYTAPSRVVHAAPRIADWIEETVADPVLIGPDSESEQWVGEVAARIGAPFTVQEKIRHGDRDVEIDIPRLEGLRDRTPVLVDDIISSGRTMLAGIEHLARLGMPPPICVGIHALFADDAHRLLREAGAARIATVDTVPHPSNEIDIGDDLAAAVVEIAGERRRPSISG